MASAMPSGVDFDHDFRNRIQLSVDTAVQVADRGESVSIRWVSPSWALMSRGVKYIPLVRLLTVTVNPAAASWPRVSSDPATTADHVLNRILE